MRRRKQPERQQQIDQFLSGIGFEKEKRGARLRPQVRRACRLVERARKELNRASHQSPAPISKRTGAAIEKLLLLGALFEVHVEELKTDNQTERAAFEQLRKLQSHAWASIACF